MKQIIATALFIAATAMPSFAGETAAPSDAKVYFINIADGDTVSSPVKVVFGLSGMGVAPAGTEKDNTGHHHLLIDRAAMGEAEDDADMIEYGIFADDNHIHFGGGQTETSVDLAPGTHTLQLVLGDLNHVPHNQPVMSELITITVE